MSEVSGAAGPDVPDERAALKARDAKERGQGICRTCAEPIWNEGGTVEHQKRETGWSDRIERGGDSLVCFKAIDYRHVPLAGREAAIWDHAVAAALSGCRRDQQERLEAVEIALQMEGDVHDRGDFDRGIQAACICVRRAMADPQSFLNPQPAAALAGEVNPE